MVKNWYVVHTYSGFENKVKASIEEKVASQALQEKIGRVMIPTEEVVELKNGKKKVSTRKFFPGYVLVELETPLQDETLQMIKETPKVTGFVAVTPSASIHATGTSETSPIAIGTTPFCCACDAVEAIRTTTRDKCSRSAGSAGSACGTPRSRPRKNSLTATISVRAPYFSAMPDKAMPNSSASIRWSDGLEM